MIIYILKFLEHSSEVFYKADFWRAPPFLHNLFSVHNTWDFKKFVIETQILFTIKFVINFHKIYQHFATSSFMPVSNQN